MVLKTKHFNSTHQRPRTPPDGTSLEEQVNAFLATLALSAVRDVQFDVVERTSAQVQYLGVVIYTG